MDTTSLYLCVACYRTASSGPGTCARCHVDRLPLTNPEVRDDLRKETERRLQKKWYREYFWIELVAFALTVWMFPFQILFIPVYWIVAGLLLGWMGSRVYAFLRPKSALGLMRERKQLTPRGLEVGPDDPGGDDL